jgi:dTDP-4-amino-4,6-dideoxygalactose transaminase
MLDDDRDRLKEYLGEQGIETKIHYPEILDTVNKGLYPVAENICRQAISLPIYPFLQDVEIDHICEKIKNFHGI